MSSILPIVLCFIGCVTACFLNQVQCLDFVTVATVIQLLDYLFLLFSHCQVDSLTSSLSSNCYLICADNSKNKNKNGNQAVGNTFIESIDTNISVKNGARVKNKRCSVLMDVGSRFNFISCKYNYHFWRPR